jgi:hypothetical protein
VDRIEFRVLSRWKSANAIKITIDRDATNKARQQFPSMTDQIVGTFESPVKMYRIFDGEELSRILRTGRITGGTYSAKAERTHGASWGHNITEVIEIGNKLRGKRYGDDLFLARLDAMGVRFHHLNPKVPFDPNGPPHQSGVMEDSACCFGLGCSMIVGLEDVDLFVVHSNHQMDPISTEEARNYVEKRPKKDVDLREINPQLYQGSILDHDVRVWLTDGKWQVILNDDRVIVNDAPTKDDAIETAKIGIRLRPGKPVPTSYQILLRKKKYEKHFEQDEDPNKIRGDFSLKPRDRVLVEKGSRGLNIPAHSSATVADVYQRTGDRTVTVKLIIGDRPVSLYAQHPNRLGDPEIALMNSGGDRILIRKKATMSKLTLKVAARYAAEHGGLDVGYGPAGTGLTYQAEFDPTTKCFKCGKDARLAITIKEKPGGDAVCHLYDNHDEGKFWLHDLAAYAIYLCPDVDCAEATTLWNQG